MAEVVFHNVGKAFGTRPVLKNVSLTICDGEFIGLVGPSGCGKSTLLRILAGLDRQDSGSVSISGRIVDHVPPKHRNIAMVFQSYALYPQMTAAENIALPLKMKRLSMLQRLPLVGRLLPGSRSALDGIDGEVQSTANALGIGHILHCKPGRLSGGERQRVALGRAMVRRPAVFLMDEPLSNLDATLRVTMRAEIKELHRKLGATFLYVTHDQTEAMTMADRVCVLLDGEILQVAPPPAIYDNPVDRRVAEFIGSPKINLLDGTILANGCLQIAGSILLADLSSCTASSVTVGIRPEAFHLSEHAGPTVLTGFVRMVENLGSDLFAHVDLSGAPERIIARLPAERSSCIGVGQTLHLTVRADRILLFDRGGRRLRRDNVTMFRSFA